LFRSLRTRRHAAFTLAEVMVTVAILAIVALWALPVLSGRGDIDVQSAARRLVTDLAFAQGDAMNRQEYRRIHFLEDGSGWCVLAADADELDLAFDAESARFVHDPIAGADRGGAMRVDFGRDGIYAGLRVDLASIDGGARDLIFDPMGGLVDATGGPSAGGSVVLRSGEDATLVEFAPFTGKVRLSAWVDAPSIGQ
jgi:prepilin-type N-terminal cleavage/methylation domain-containing protein